MLLRMFHSNCGARVEPPPNPSFELTRYSVAPRLPKGCASRIVPLGSQGATPQPAAQFQR